MIDYDSHDWRSHLWDIRGSMLREILLRVLLCVGWAAVVTFVHQQGYWKLGISPTAHLMIGAAIGLLLVFRTNSSYDRFWEGRKMWGGIVNETRNLARLSSAALAAAPDLRERVIRWTICFPDAAMHSLRGVRWLSDRTDKLPRDEIQTVLDAEHIPLATARKITGTLAAARDRGVISDFVFLAIDQNVQLLIDYLGACERIQKTPLPFAYVVHLRRTLIIYCYTLPFAMLDQFGWWTILVTLLVTYIFAGIEEIGVEIEGPFGIDDNDLPLERICDDIAKNLEGVLAAPKM